MRVITSPTVQLGLNLPYPSLRPIQHELRFVGIHRRPPGISAPPCRLAGPLRHVRAFRVLGLLQGLRPTPQPSVATDLPSTRPGARRIGRPWVVPTFTMDSIDEGGARLYPDSIATPTPQYFDVASPPDR